MAQLTPRRLDHADTPTAHSRATNAVYFITQPIAPWLPSIASCPIASPLTSVRASVVSYGESPMRRALSRIRAAHSSAVALGDSDNNSIQKARLYANTLEV
jgi:hypothetical protein